MSEVRVIEQHPIFHNWYLHGDFVQAKTARGRITVIKRVEHCVNCPTECYTFIDVTQWSRGPRRYKYAPNTVIQRIAKSEYLKQTFLGHNMLSNDERRAIK